MAKFRSNHSNPTAGKKSYVVRVILFGLVLMLLLWGLLNYFKKYEATHSTIDVKPLKENNSMSYRDSLNGLSVLNVSIPSCKGNNEIISHAYFTLCYAEADEQAEWVAYELTRERLNKPKISRIDYFVQDDKIRSGSASHFDYVGSGFDRGHLAPASDMSFLPLASQESFLMSNISPQVRAFNEGIWRELEEDVRDWARKYKKLYVVTGPVLQTGLKKIGKNKVSVPLSFYKVLLDIGSQDSKGIGFVIPNVVSELSLYRYMVTIDSVEQLTGINFFNADHNDTMIEELENKVDPLAWPVNEARYVERVEVWNKKEMSKH